MFFVGNKKFEKLEHTYEFLKGALKNYLEDGDEKKIPPIIIYYNEEILYDSSNLKNNPVFYISRGIKVDLLGAFLLKSKNVSGTIKYKDEVLWKFSWKSCEKENFLLDSQVIVMLEGVSKISTHKVTKRTLKCKNIIIN